MSNNDNSSDKKTNTTASPIQHPQIIPVLGASAVMIGSQRLLYNSTENKINLQEISCKALFPESTMCYEPLDTSDLNIDTGLALVFGFVAHAVLKRVLRPEAPQQNTADARQAPSLRQ